jgi:hypothetical protein
MTPSHCLPAELTIYTVGELRPLWLTWLADVRSRRAKQSRHSLRRLSPQVEASPE